MVIIEPESYNGIHVAVYRDTLHNNIMALFDLYNSWIDINI